MSAFLFKQRVLSLAVLYYNAARFPSGLIHSLREEHLCKALSTDPRSIHGKKYPLLAKCLCAVGPERLIPFLFFNAASLVLEMRAIHIEFLSLV
jgi:hypothetical protein